MTASSYPLRKETTEDGFKWFYYDLLVFQLVGLEFMFYSRSFEDWFNNLCSKKKIEVKFSIDQENCSTYYTISEKDLNRLLKLI
jgi:hypothetical protein